MNENVLKKSVSINFKPFIYWTGGVLFTFIIALLSFQIAKVPGFNYIGPLATAIIVSIIYRQIFGYPEKIKTGAVFSAKKLLRAAIILYGLKLNIDIIFKQGLGLVGLGIISIAFSIILTLLIAKWLNADFNLSLLVGVGTGVCGAAAIAAVSPILKSKEEDTAISIGIIALVGTAFSILYALLIPVIPLAPDEFGIWAGLSLHELANVATAAAPAGEEVLAIALLAKLGRVFLLVPLCFVLIYWKKKKQTDTESETKIHFPWFLVGFIAMSIVGSYVIGNIIFIPEEMMSDVSIFTTFLLTMAMAGLGLNVNLKALRSKAMRPFIAMSITSVLLSILTLFII
ncbi:YeiH family protein [Chengkuizengella axinellae]|uniref:Sulfate exporter family transporter n=1 Tax=Chengkuizengella axinellae TaxID=3064388 RepID=A0ABT9J0N9_9BACL|nr:putative sulfate exporter family transporter [Chengkuizengella sp. 2205SS18-9]MDP5275135.1 putative sulfate exporter family transporter [Chengkuizengella sp. 2205SS18-9]